MDLLSFMNNGVLFRNKNNSDVDLTKNSILRFRKKSINKLEPESFWRQTGLVSTGDPRLISGKKACQNFSDMVTCDRCGASIPAYLNDTLCPQCAKELEKFSYKNSLTQIAQSNETVKRLEKDRIWFFDMY